MAWAKPILYKQTYTPYMIKQLFSLLNKLSRILGWTKVNVWGYFCKHSKHIRTYESFVVVVVPQFEPVFFLFRCLPEPLLHLTSVFVPVLLWLLPASEYCPEALWVSKMFRTWKEAVSLKSTPSCPFECQTLYPRLPLPYCPWDVCALIDIDIWTWIRLLI